MIVVRETFHIDPSHMMAAKELLKEMHALGDRLGLKSERIYTDLTGEYHRLVMETEFENLAAFEANLLRAFSDPDWQSIYDKLRPMITGSQREIFTALDL